MKILHTADWHLGKKLDKYSRFEEQVQVMREICEIADREDVDIVIVAGDLFDSIHPSIEAVELYYKTLKRLSNEGTRPVIAIAGNHDSPSFIDAPDPLARECGIFFVGYPNAVVQPISLINSQIVRSDESFIELKLDKYAYPFRLIHTAYANEVRLKQYLGEEKDRGLNEALSTHWAAIAEQYCDKLGVNMLAAHLYMNQQGATLIEESDGEKSLKLGTADLVYTKVIPEQIQYTALGHIHNYMNIGSPEKPIVYSSSPLQYSFSEAGQQKYVIVIEAEPNVTVRYEKVELNSGKQLIRKSFENVDTAVEWLANNPNTLVEIAVESDTYLKAEERKLIFNSHDGIIHLIPKVKHNEIEETVIDTSINLELSMPDLFEAYFKSKNANQAPSEELFQLFQEILNN